MSDAMKYNFSGIEGAPSASTEFDGIKATEAGDNGNDVAMMGAGDDVFQWDPGDGDPTSGDAFDFKAPEESEAAGTQVKTFLCPSNRTSLDGDGVDDLATYQPDTTAIGPGESFTYTLDPREVGASDGADYSGSHLLYQDVMIPTLDTGSWLM